MCYAKKDEPNTIVWSGEKLTTLWGGVSEKDGDVWGKLEARTEGKGLKGNSSVWNMKMGTEEDERK